MVINVRKWFQNMLARLVCFNPSLYEMLEWPSQLVAYLLHSKLCLLLSPLAESTDARTPKLHLWVNLAE